ncbi:MULTISPECIES: cytochrome c1 [unclassified Pseudovibrio]|uniref:cytochrome c1 n=1 Tax=unclassified Pseudovibrio TaxID=2627060 RepID=UPI0007AEB5B2|nr:MULTISPECIES: cytochrome c1 [unclassified Pseudovibrio]KZL14483.1 Cytochrome b/c1 [Pseudovibrio sp. Ad37]KZL25397.1 Cytochrome b/c1 [Pseudovibrio sp. WM33]
MKNLMFKSARALAVVAGLAVAGPALAAGDGPHVEKQPWSFAGPFGQFDKAQLQRGFQVYQEVCSACHGLSYVAFRNLAEEGGPGFSVDEVKALAAEYSIEDGPDNEGEMFERDGKPFDKFPSPFPNEQAARASNNGALPPDLSLIAKARAATRGFPWFVLDVATQYQENGPDYLYGLLTGYHEAPEGVEVPEGQYYNPGFIAGHTLAMAPPLSDELVEYSDGSPMTVDQYARDVSAFLMWTAEPHLESRKRIGFGVMAFLILFASLLYFTKRKIWRDVDH